MTFIFIVALGYFLYRLSERVEVLETKIKELGKTPGVGYEAAPAEPYVSPVEPHVAPVVSVAAPMEPMMPAPIEEVLRPIASIDPVGESAFMEWIKKDFFVKLGALLVLLPVVWFLTQLVKNGVIGPVGQVSIGLLTGVALMWFGLRRSATFPHQGGIFTVLGSTIILITVFIGREVYFLFTPLSALVVMALSVMFVSYVAILYRSPNLALASILLGAIVPFLTGAESSNTLMLFTYLTLLVLGGLWILTRMESPYLLLSTLGVVYLYSMPYLAGDAAAAELSLVAVFAFLFTLIFFLSALSSLLNRAGGKPQIAELLVAAGSALYVAIMIQGAIDASWHSLLFTAWALVFAFGSYLLFIHTKNTTAFYVYGATAMGFLAAATAAELEGPVLYIMLTLEIAALVLMAVRYLGHGQASSVAWLLIFPIIYAVDSFDSSAWSTGIFHEDFVVVTLVTTVLAVVSYSLYQAAVRENEEPSKVVLVLGVVAGMQTMAIIWLTAEAYLPSAQAIMVSLLIYLVTGLASYIEGVSRGSDVLHKIGIVLIGLVVLRLMTVDVWQMEITNRIITFLLVGVLLISTAFIKKLQNK